MTELCLLLCWEQQMLMLFAIQRYTIISMQGGEPGASFACCGVVLTSFIFYGGRIA